MMIYKKKSTFSRRHYYAVFNDIADIASTKIARNIYSGIKKLREKIPVRNIKDALERNDINLVIDLIPFEEFEKSFERMKLELEKNLIESGERGIKYLPKKIEKALVEKPEIQFDAKNPRIRKVIDKHVGELITEVTKESKLAVKKIIKFGMNYGISRETLAKQIQNHIGLNSRLETAVSTYAASLLARDLGIDEVVERADKYAEGLLKYRANMIARTESIWAVNHGQLETYRQAIEQGFVEKEKMFKEWVIDPETACEFCRPLEGERVSVDESFKTDLGTVSAPPLHPNCNCGIMPFIEGM